MKFAYADPPYLGQSHLYPEHPEADVWDDPTVHRDLIWSLADDKNLDGWAYSASSQSLRALLPYCPEDIRVMAWVKPFAAFKKHVNPSFAWEPIIVRGGRGRTDENTYMRDWVAESITLKKGLTGAKPKAFCWWLFDVWNAKPGDTLDDLYPGTGIVGEAWDEYMERYDEVASRINRVSSSWEQGKGVLR